MQNTQAELSLRDLDRVLDELEELAVNSETSTAAFYEACLRRLQAILQNQAVGLAVSMSANDWNLLCSLGNWDWPATLQRVTGHLTSVHCTPKNGYDLAVCLVSNLPARLAIIAGLSSQIDALAYAEIVRLCEAFAEVIGLRFRFDLESCQKRYVPAFQQLLTNLHRSVEVSESECLLANDLTAVLQAERVTIVRPAGLKGPVVRTISNLVGPIKNTALVKQIEKIGKRVLAEQKSISGNDLAEAADTNPTITQDRLQWYFAFPLGGQEIGEDRSGTAVVVQWAKQEKFQMGMAILEQIGITLGLVWSNQQRWLCLPRWLRTVGGAVPTRHNRWARSWFKYSIRIGVLAIIAGLLINPRDLRIELDGTLEPKSQRTIFAALDGTVDQVLVNDGQIVRAGDVLAIMKSTDLQMQIKEVEGEINAIAEKRKGLSLSFNQLGSDETTAPAARNRLAAEIRQLDTHNDILQQKRATMKEMEQKLELRSPIDGVVIARDIELLLDQRPVRRGDGLLRIVAADKDWCLRLRVSDADAGYLGKKMFAGDDIGTKISESADTKIDFLFVAKPDLSFSANIDWLSAAARNPQGEGVIVDLTAVPEPEAVKHGHVGATVKAYVTCDRRPTWFVLSRPLVEAIQRKLWF